MATLDDINILDYRSPTPEELLQAGRKPVAEPTPPTPIKDFLYYDVLNPSGRKLFDIASAEITNPLNYLVGATPIVQGAKGIKAVTKLKEEGFDVDNPLYHGTHETFKTFDPSKIGARDKGFYGKGFYFTNNKKEAEMYGPNVGEYYIKGKILNLGDFSELDRVMGKGTDYRTFKGPLEDYKLWAGKLNAVNALPPVQKRAYDDFVKADKYFEENYELIPTTKIETGPAKGQMIYQGRIKDPYYDNDIVVDDVYDKDDLKEIFFIEMEGNHPSFPNFKHIKRNVSDFTRDADNLEYDEGVADVAEYISEKVKASGYAGINSGSETVIFDPKNILKVEKNNLADDIDKVAQGISNRQQKIRKLQRELELEGGDMLPKTKKQTQQKIAKLIQEVNEMSK